MSKHTAGPWLCEDGEICAEIGGAHIALLPEFPCIDDEDVEVIKAELEANARLIAAAPELLEACRLALELFAFLPNSKHSGRIVEVAERIEAAVSKATEGK